MKMAEQEGLETTAVTESGAIPTGDQSVPMPDGEIQIEDGVAIPKDRRKEKYPWTTLKIGQSFLFPAELQQNSPYQSAKSASLRHAPKTFIARKTPGGTRCWRIA
jgi:hypothetical protein